MFGHLRAEDFTNLLEGAPLPDRQRAHLQGCSRCMETFSSIQETRSRMEDLRSETTEYIPEPDWSEFRSDVRNALLSRSVKRQTAGRGWLGGLGWQPAMAWGISMLLVFGVTTLLWRQQPVSTDPASEEENIGSLAEISQRDAFDDLLHLSAAETDSLQMILDEDVAQTGVSRQ